MIDLAQADRTLRTNNRPAPYGWVDVKPNQNVTRGDLCVIRRSNGSPEILKIDNQTQYKEWVGCFSIV